MLGDAAQLTQKQPERRGRDERQESQREITSSARHQEGDANLRTCNQQPFAPTQRPGEIGADSESSRVARTGRLTPASGLSRCHSLSHGVESSNLQVVEALRIVHLSNLLMMAPVLSRKTMEVYSCDRAQGRTDAIVQIRILKQRAMDAIVHYERDAISQETDERRQEPRRESFSLSEHRCEPSTAK